MPASRRAKRLGYVASSKVEEARDELGIVAKIIRALRGGDYRQNFTETQLLEAELSVERARRALAEVPREETRDD